MLSQSASFLKLVRVFFTSLLSVEIWNFLFYKIDKVTPAFVYWSREMTPISCSYKVEPQQQTVGNHAEPQNWLWKSVHNNNENGSDRNPESACFTRGYLALLRDFPKQCFQLYCHSPTVCSRFNRTAVTMCTALRTMTTSSSFCSSLEKTLILSGKEFWRWHQILTQLKETEWNQWRAKMKNQPTTECLQRWSMCWLRIFHIGFIMY